jgi:hypothetical protein
MTKVEIMGLRRVLAPLVALAVVLLGLPAAAQQSFPTPEAAADALITALRASDRAALDQIFGAAWVQRLQASEPEERRQNAAHFVADAAAFRAIRRDGDDTAILMVGFDASPFPIPLRRVDGVWRYDPAAGAEEMLNRRIGANELTTLRASSQRGSRARRAATTVSIGTLQPGRSRARLVPCWPRRAIRRAARPVRPITATCIAS